MYNIRKKLAYYLRCGLTDMICRLGGQQWWLAEQPGNRILVYHGIDKRGEKKLNSRFLAQDQLRAQLLYCKQHFHIVRLRDLCKGNTKANRMNIAITFDDGYQNNYDLALPVLEELDLPATFFVTGIAETDYPMLWPDLIDLVARLQKGTFSIKEERFYRTRAAYSDEHGFPLKETCKLSSWSFQQLLYPAILPLLTAEELEQWKLYWHPMSTATIQQMAQHPLVDIGAHGWWHDNLGVVELDIARERLVWCQEYLQTRIGIQPDLLAYPTGSYTPALRDMAKELGFRYQMAMDYIDISDAPERGIFERLTINPHCSLANQVRAILTGRY